MTSFLGSSRGVVASARLLAALGIALAPAAASAQILSVDAEGALFCAPVADTACTSDAGCGTGHRCAALPSGERACVPAGAIFCCFDGGCPSTTADMPTTCRAASDLSGSSGVCVSPGDDYCEASDIEALARCHLAPSTTRLVPWAQGDCDDDGLANGDEVEAGTDPCAAPAPVAQFEGGICRPLDASCAPGTTCLANGGPGVCTPTGDGAGTFCAPPGEALYCCGANVCPNAGDGCVLLEETDVSVCVDTLCAERIADLDACVRSGDSIVPFSDGDCDEDGVANGRELAAGTDPCADDGAGDAGAPPEDAGSATSDAGGTGTDAGTREDPSLDLRFEGGGGCVCRASAGSSSPAPLMLLFAALALAISRRR